MKTALIVGATGLVGKHLLTLLLKSPKYKTVIALSRRSLNIDNDKLNEHIIDFETIDKLKFDIKIDDVFCCLGTTIKTAGTKEAFKRVDYHYVAELAQWAKQNNCEQFAVISSVGANKNTNNFYLKTKGEMEHFICELNLPVVHIFRPSLLLGDRKEFRLGEKVFEKLMVLINPLMKGRLMKYKAIKAYDVAKAMYNKAQHKQKNIFIYEGEEIQ